MSYRQEHGTTTATTTANHRQFSTIARYFRKYRGYVLLGLGTVILSNSLILTVPYLTKLIFDSLEQGRESSHILLLVGLSVLAAVLSGVFRFGMRRTIIWMSRWIEFDLRNDLFNHLLRLSPSFYHNQRTGDLMARMTNDLEAVRQMIGPGVMYISDTVIKLTVALAVMIYLSPTLTLYSLIPLILIPLSVNRIGNLIHARSMRVQEQFSDLSAAAQENLAGVRVVKAYGQEPAEERHFGEHSKVYIVLNMALAKLQGLFFPSMRMLSGLSYLVVFYFGGRQVIAGEIGLGDIVAFFGYLSMITWPMIAIGWVTSLYQRGRASLQRINRILFTEPEVADSPAAVYDAPMRGRIEFRNLTFSYNGHAVLRQVDLVLEPGQTLGIVGRTGSGKTTLVSLLPRLYQVPRGMLFIDSVDINDWKLASLRRQIAFAPQEPFLFSDTVENNVQYGRDSARQSDIAAATEIAALAKDIDTFRDGLQTVVGERGITLSGGQKQRTAIARAVLTEPSILVLDDVTSAVDTETEDEIQQGIRRVLPGRTAIIISHRVSSVREADIIVYLDEGRIAERGTHAELMRRDGQYAELYRSQLIEQELERL